jgi:hypothetical protein
LASPSPAPQSPPPVPTVSGQYKTEQEWIIASVCRSIYELISYAADQRGEVIALNAISLSKVGDEPLSYAVTVTTSHGPVQATLVWPGSIWAEDAYVPFCKACADFLKYSPPNPPTVKPQGNALHDLLIFSQTAMKKESDRIGAWIEKEPANPIAQEDAALVLGTLAMKENSGAFWDPREACNRVAAHLAVALYFEPSLQVDGQVADCLVGLIADTKVICAQQIDKLAALPNPPPDLAAWLSAARLRNKRDWTALVFPAQATGLEQVEYFRALAEAVGTDNAIVWLRQSNLADRVDWARIILQLSYSVEAGHIFADPAIGKEIHAMQLTFPGSYKESLIDDLNQVPGGSLTVGDNHIQVISPGMWAQFFQRHLCHAMDMEYDFLAHMWGVPDQANQVKTAIKTHFSNLTLFPYLNLRFEPGSNPPDDFDLAAKAFSSHPEFAQAWLAESKYSVDKVGLKQWFNPPVLHGTAYSFYAPYAAFIADTSQADQTVQNLYKIAPLSFGVASMELNRRCGGPDKQSFEDAKAVMGPLLNYYMPAMELAVYSKDITPEHEEAMLKRAAEIDPNWFYNLAYFYGVKEKPDEEARAYQDYFDKCTDRVSVSNRMDFLVNYYFDHDQKDKALEIAQNAADVYSERGLETLLKLKERMADLAGAEDLGQKIKDRYEDAQPLMAFYRRQVALGKSEYQSKLQASDGAIFPDGVKKVTLSSFNGPPKSGAILIGESSYTKQYGIQPNYVIVALDGVAVNSNVQYQYVRSLTDDPNMTLILWDGTQYKELKVNLPNRRFGTGLGDYKP